MGRGEETGDGMGWEGVCTPVNQSVDRTHLSDGGREDKSVDESRQFGKESFLLRPVLDGDMLQECHHGRRLGLR